MFTYMKLKGLKILEFSNGDQYESKIKKAFFAGVGPRNVFAIRSYDLHEGFRACVCVCVCVGDHRILVLRHNLRCISQQQVFVAE